MRSSKALADLRICADSHEPSMLADAIGSELSCNARNIYVIDYLYLFIRHIHTWPSVVSGNGNNTNGVNAMMSRVRIAYKSRRKLPILYA